MVRSVSLLCVDYMAYVNFIIECPVQDCHTRPSNIKRKIIFVIDTMCLTNECCPFNYSSQVNEIDLFGKIRRPFPWLMHLYLDPLCPNTCHVTGNPFLKLLYSTRMNLNCFIFSLKFRSVQFLWWIKNPFISNHISPIHQLR